VVPWQEKVGYTWIVYVKGEIRLMLLLFSETVCHHALAITSNNNTEDKENKKSMWISMSQSKIEKIADILKLERARSCPIFCWKLDADDEPGKSENLLMMIFYNLFSSILTFFATHLIKKVQR
jgi:hypothetical protein